MKAGVRCGPLISSALIRKEHSFVEAAAAIGVDRNALRRWADNKPVPLNKLAKVAAYLGVEPETLLPKEPA